MANPLRTEVKAVLIIALLLIVTFDAICPMAAGPEPSQLIEPMTVEGMVFQVLKTGGLPAVLLVVLFFYRRDYKTLCDYWQSQNVMATTLVGDNTKAITGMSDAIRHNTEVINATKDVLQAFGVVLPEPKRER
jgi:hypothetical protein